MTDQEYQWFAQHHVKNRCVMGTDYYVSNEHVVNSDHTISHSGEIFRYYVLTHQYYDRYRLPVMHTETNLKNTDKATEWLYKEWFNMHRLKLDGVPILGFTALPIRSIGIRH